MILTLSRVVSRSPAAISFRTRIDAEEHGFFCILSVFIHAVRPQDTLQGCVRNSLADDARLENGRLWEGR